MDDDLFLSGDDLAAQSFEANRVLGLIAGTTIRETTREWVAPPFPLIGVGLASGAPVSRCDTLIEPPVTTDMVIDAIRMNPNAAAVAVQLLRTLDALDTADGLVAESLAYAGLQTGGEHRRWLASNTAMPLPAGQVLLTREGNTLRITLDRPWAGNAIDVAMRDGLREAFELAGADPDIDRVILTGRGKAFSLGGDLPEFGTTRDPDAAHAIRLQTLPAHAIWPIAHKFEAHVDGACIGAGIEMAAFAHRLTATARAWFQLPELAMGLIPGAGGCVSLSKRIGRQRTALMILSGRRIGARTALDWGLIDAIVDE